MWVWNKYIRYRRKTKSSYNTPSQNCNALLCVIEIPRFPCSNHLAVYRAHTLENFVGTTLKIGASLSRGFLVGDEGCFQRQARKKTAWVWHVWAGQLIGNRGEALDHSVGKPKICRWNSWGWSLSCGYCCHPSATLSHFPTDFSTFPIPFQPCFWTSQQGLAEHKGWSTKSSLPAPRLGQGGFCL